MLYQPYVNQNTMGNKKWEFILFLSVFVVLRVVPRAHIISVQCSTIVYGNLVFVTQTNTDIKCLINSIDVSFCFKCKTGFYDVS